MIKLGILSLAVVLATLSAPVARAESADESGIKQALQAFVESWNKHDAKAMTEHWMDSGDLINPAGRMAHGKAEIEKLITEEHASVMKSTTASMDMKEVHMLGDGLALVDVDMMIKGMMGPNGKAMPPMPLHVAVTMKKDGGAWKYSNARPYAFLKPMPSLSKGAVKSAKK